MYRDTVTVFNRYNGTWKGTVLHNVDLNVDRAMMLRQYGENSQDRSKLHLKYTETGGHYYVDGKMFVAPAEYSGADGTFTLAEGNNMSFYMEGTAPILSASDSAYLDGFFDYMNSHYDVFAITSVARYSVIPHFEIVGR